MLKAPALDQGLEAAIAAAGSASELARRIGVSQPSVSNWQRVPAGRVVAVESATGVSRTVLRPDLYGTSIEGVELARAQEYALLATLLVRAPTGALLKRIVNLSMAETPLDKAHGALAEAASAADIAQVEREYFELFIGVARGELLPYGSYYLTGFLHERPLARLRDDLARLGIERAEDRAEPEDHAGTLCEIMSGLIGGPFMASVEIQRQFFVRHLTPWIGRFFADLKSAEAANFYRHVGTVGRIFIDIETEAFGLLA